ncbi:3-ketoacyl-CoA thiolase, mitochondrial-like [Watersipora subatra]|uniref:3-ketoacyl-CoA thiolase, mitochondrial-like n=1 Tax=Watersipora subatra TaxID=2589382 RepID=UPI00355B6323
MSMARGIFIVGAKRTPFGTFGGKLKDHTATDLAAAATAAALKSAGIAAEQVDTAVCGNVCSTSVHGPYIARHMALQAGVKIETPCLTVNRLCGSGFQSIVNGAQELQLSESEIAVCAGAENMSMAPYALRGARFGTKLGVDLKLEDSLWATLTDHGIKTPMGMTAENLAEKYNISREECDKYALASQERWKLANGEGRFEQEMAPIILKSRKGEEEFKVDEHPKTTTLERMSKLPPVFKKDGTVNAGNASGICDGAGSIVLASEDAVKAHNLKPLARLVNYHVSGCDPHIMGIGPVPAIRQLLSKTGYQLSDVDMVEINEAFAPQTLACMKELGLEHEKTNVNGGAIAMGHPVGASGSRITAHLCYELQRTQKRLAIGSACIGGGQGIALLLERC